MSKVIIVGNECVSEIEYQQFNGLCDHMFFDYALVEITPNNFRKIGYEECKKLDMIKNISFILSIMKVEGGEVIPVTVDEYNITRDNLIPHLYQNISTIQLLINNTDKLKAMAFCEIEYMFIEDIFGKKYKTLYKEFYTNILNKIN